MGEKGFEDKRGRFHNLLVENWLFEHEDTYILYADSGGGDPGWVSTAPLASL